MWSAILSFGGWVVFWVLLLFFVRWVGLEKAFFEGQDPENWRPDFPRETSPMTPEQPKPMGRLSRLASLGRPA